MNILKYSAILILISATSIISCKSQPTPYNPNESVIVKRINTDKISLSEFIDTTLLQRSENEIINFKKDDSVNINRKTDIVFVGSSSIRKWTSLKEDLKGLNAINRGFGGSTVAEAIYYSNTLILKHKPKKIVFYSGDNDVAILNSSSKKILKSYKLFYELIANKLPDTKLFILSIKPSPDRIKFWPQMNEINKMLKNYCTKTKNCEFIDVSTCIFDENKKIKSDVFLKDGIHLNEKGYEIWTSIIYPIILN